MIQTSSFYYYKGWNGVSIARSTPKDYKCIACPELCPDWSLVSGYKRGDITEKQYRKAYIKQLKALNVHVMYKKLDNYVLLCYEPDGKFCHRQIVAEWFVRNGYKCKEIPYVDFVSCNKPSQLYKLCKSFGYFAEKHKCKEYYIDIIQNGDELPF